ncbi:MAG: hypothetical protein J6R29_01305 [Clostridia bacterium]|nr:hypothetical protein [Clostridia bacterium]
MQDFEIIYKLGMLIIGFGGLVLGFITLIRSVKRERRNNIKKQKNK